MDIIDTTATATCENGSSQHFGDDGTMTVLITGATGGLGTELANLFAGDGYNLVLVARNQQKLDKAAASLCNEHGVDIATFACDLSQSGAAERIFDFVEQQGIVVNALVNNAGFGYDAPFVESDLSRQRDLVQVNDMALMELCYLFGVDMAAREAGEILNIASMAGFMPGTYMATYYASKAFVQSFSQALHAELKPYGVHVTALCPGPLRTDFWKEADADKTFLGGRLASAGRVAADGYTALKNNKALCVPWLFPKAIVFLTRFTPYSVMRWATGVIQNPKQQRK